MQVMSGLGKQHSWPTTLELLFEQQRRDTLGLMVRQRG